MNAKRDALLIVDYNNSSRVRDVKAMIDYGRKRYGLASVLARAKLDPVDHTLADHALQLDPSSPSFSADVRRQTEALGLSIRAVFPFSDRAIVGGSQLAESLGLATDSSSGALAALSKLVYRERESWLGPFLPDQRIFAPRAHRIHSLADLVAFARASAGDFILKPACEGNNRGVVRLSRHSNLGQAFHDVERYLDRGVLVEELIPYSEEYSFDGVGHLCFLTEKLSARGRYPVERGQRVPARGPVEKHSALQRAGRVANFIVGQGRGPFHNEIKYDPASRFTAVVEPNRRPAGMRIWDLAERVYGVNFYQIWMDAIISGKLMAELPPARGVAAIRMLGAPAAGVLAPLGLDQRGQADLLRRLSRGLPGEWFNFEISTQPGQEVQATPRDNSHFLASVCVYCRDSAVDPDQALDQFESRWLRFIASYVADPSPLAASA